MATSHCHSMTETPRQRPGDSWADQAAPHTFYALHGNALTDTYPASGFRLEVRDEGFQLLSVHWSARAALGEVGERLAQGEKAAVYVATWERIESENDPRLKRHAGE